MHLLQRDLIMDSRAGGNDGGRARLVLSLDEFAAKAVKQEATKLGVSAEELASFAVLYYLADLDSGRIARRPLVDAPARVTRRTV